MTKINMASSEYWKNLIYDFKGLFKVYPIQVLSSLIVSVIPIIAGFSEGAGGERVYSLVLGISYFLGTNLLLLIVSEKIENGWAQNSVTAHVLFGTSTDRLELSFFYWILKGIVVVFKVVFSPFLLLIGLFQYQAILNKIIAKQELEN